jgi:hypothetical protein
MQPCGCPLPVQNPVPNAYTLAIAGRKPFIVSASLSAQSSVGRGKGCTSQAMTSIARDGSVVSMLNTPRSEPKLSLSVLSCRHTHRRCPHQPSHIHTTHGTHCSPPAAQVVHTSLLELLTPAEVQASG